MTKYTAKSFLRDWKSKEKKDFQGRPRFFMFSDGEWCCWECLEDRSTRLCIVSAMNDTFRNPWKVGGIEYFEESEYEGICANCNKPLV